MNTKCNAVKKNNHEVKEFYLYEDGVMLLTKISLEDIILKFAPLINSVVTSIYYKVNKDHIYIGFLKEDLLQEAYIIAIKAYNNYNADTNVSFNFYLKNTLHRTLFQTVIRKINKNKNSYLALDYNDNTRQLGDVGFEDAEITDLMYNADLSICIKKHLNKEEELILKYKIAELTQTEISEKTNISQATVSRTLTEIKTKLKDVLITDLNTII